MPTPDNEEDAAPSAMDDAQFWYVVWRIGLSTAYALFGSVYFIIMAVLDPANAAAPETEVDVWIGEHRIVAVALSVIVCIAVASWYQIGFWRAVVVCIAGSVTATLICIPLLATGYTAGSYPGLISALGYFAISMLYAIGCGYAGVRRLTRATRRQRALIEMFD